MSSELVVESSYPILPISVGTKFLSGYAFKGQDFGDIGFPVIKIKNIQDRLVSTAESQRISETLIKGSISKFHLSNRDVLIAMTGQGSVGRVGRLKCSKFEKPLMNQRVGKFIADEKNLHIDYLYYVISSPSFESLLFDLGSGSGQPNLSPDAILSLKIPFPRYEDQTEIATILNSLDDRITLLRETNTTLEAIAQALFKSWFVDFDPVHAKQQGREPVGMDASTAALFPDSFEESELGLVPMGWRVGTLADLATLNSESWTAKTHPKTVQYIDLANAKNNEIDVVTEYDFDEAPSRARRVLRAGDSIIGTVRPGNRSFAYIHQAPGNLTGSTGFAVLRPKEPRNTEFVFVAATQDSSIDHLAHVADGGAYPAVRPEVVANIQTILPTAEIMAEFHNVAAPIFAKIGENHLQAQTLTSLRDTLLPRLISGQLHLTDINVAQSEPSL